MRNEASQSSARSLIIFFALTFAIAWAFFLLAGAISKSASADPFLYNLRQVFYLPGVFAPAIVAIALTYKDEGSGGVRALLNRVFQWEVGARWFVLAVGYFAAVKLTVGLLHRAFVGTWPRFGDTPWYIMAAAILFSTPFQSGEEIGWRGYALPRLAHRLGFAGASIVLGLIWALWHLPLFFIPGTDTFGQPFFVYTLQVVALSVAITFLYVRTNGSLLLPMILHAAVNNSMDLVPSAVTTSVGNPFSFAASRVAWLTVAVLWICAAFFLVRLRAGDASDLTPTRAAPN